jgi:hypothetical protein
VLAFVAITLNITKDTEGENSSQKTRNSGSGMEVQYQNCIDEFYKTY